MDPQIFERGGGGMDSDSSGGTVGSGGKSSSVPRRDRDRHHSGGGGGGGNAKISTNIITSTEKKVAGGVTGKIVSPSGQQQQQHKVGGGGGSRLPENFLVALTGRIESGQLFGINDIYCKYNFSYGSDWQITSGLEEGISQITTKDLDGKFVWNFPIEVTFKSSNPHGWPQLVVSLYGSDFLGNHVARGYGSTFIPVHQGCSTKTIPLFVPESSSFIQKISSWIVGRRPEFIDPKIVAQSEGRQVVRVNSCGTVTVKFEVVLKDFRKLGFVSSTHHSEDFSM